MYIIHLNLKITLYYHVLLNNILHLYLIKFNFKKYIMVIEYLLIRIFILNWYIFCTYIKYTMQD